MAYNSVNISDLTSGFFIKASSGCFFIGLLCSLFFTGLEGQLFFISQGFLWGYFLGVLLYSSGRFSLPFSQFSLLFSLFFFVSVLTLFWTPVPGYTQIMLWRQGAVFLVFLELILSQDQGRWSRVQVFLGIVAVAVSVVAIWQYLAGGQPKASFLNKNSLAGFLLPILFWNILAAREKMWVWSQRLLLFGGGAVLGIIGSRGALLACVSGLLCVFALSRLGRLKLSRWFGHAGALLSGLMASLVLTGLELGRGAGRLISLSDPWSAGADRFVIWQSSWEMLKDAPWYGLGVGIYGLAYPPYRDIADKSAGHFAHNDLLQICIENGWPGLIFCLLAGLSLMRLVWRSLFCADLPDANKYEIVALAGGLSALCFHSLFTFNFYVYSTLLVVGVLIARIYSLLPSSMGKTIQFDLSRCGRLLKFAPPLLCLLPIFLIFSGGWSQLATQKALAALENDQTEQVFKHLGTAKRWWPTNDFNWYMEGEVLRLGFDTGNQLSPEDNVNLFTYAGESFEKAFELNPLRAMTPHKLGLLLENSHVEGYTPNVEEVIRLYRTALAIDPGYFPARMDLVKVFLKLNDDESARKTIKDGLQRYYQDVPGLIPYLRLASDYLLMDGDTQGAQMLEERIQAIKMKWEDQ